MSDTNQLLENLNALAGGLFLLAAFGLVAMRQARGCLNLFITQSLLLAASAALLGLRHHSEHLYGVAIVNLISSRSSSRGFCAKHRRRKFTRAGRLTRR